MIGSKILKTVSKDKDQMNILTCSFEFYFFGVVLGIGTLN